MKFPAVTGRPTLAFARFGLPGLSLLALSALACATSAPGADTAPRLSQDWAQVPQVTLVRQQRRSDCGSAALTMVLAHFDPRTEVTQVRQTLGSGDGKSAGKIAEPDTDQQAGIAAGRLRDLARAQGLKAYVIEATFADLAHEIGLGHPVLVGLYRIVGNRGFPHYEVVAGINPRDQMLLLADPAEGWRKEAFSRFAARWQLAHNLAVVIFPAEGLGDPPVARNDDHRQQPD